MNRDDDGETSYNTFVDDVALEPTYLQALPTAAGRNVATTPTSILADNAYIALQITYAEDILISEAHSSERITPSVIT